MKMQDIFEQTDPDKAALERQLAKAKEELEHVEWVIRKARETLGNFYKNLEPTAAQIVRELATYADQLKIDTNNDPEWVVMARDAEEAQDAYTTHIMSMEDIFVDRLRAAKDRVELLTDELEGWEEGGFGVDT